jgi:hypothetical protein
MNVTSHSIINRQSVKDDLKARLKDGGQEGAKSVFTTKSMKNTKGFESEKECIFLASGPPSMVLR